MQSNPHLCWRMNSVLRSFSSHVSFSSAMIFSDSWKKHLHVRYLQRRTDPWAQDHCKSSANENSNTARNTKIRRLYFWRSIGVVAKLLYLKASMRFNVKVRRSIGDGFNHTYSLTYSTAKKAKTKPSTFIRSKAFFSCSFNASSDWSGTLTSRHALTPAHKYDGVIVDGLSWIVCRDW